MYQRNLVATSKLDADGEQKLMMNIPVDLRRLLDLRAGQKIIMIPQKGRKSFLVICDEEYHE